MACAKDLKCDSLEQNPYISTMVGEKFENCICESLKADNLKYNSEEISTMV